MNFPSISLKLAAFTALITGSVAEAQLPGVSNVVAAPVVEKAVAATQTFVASVEPTRRATIGSAVDGRVVQFAVQEGDRVKAGQTLARLLTETISLELTGAKAELELRKQQLAELENGARPEEIEQARAKMAATEAMRKFAQARMKRVESVYQTSGAISADEFEEAVALAAEAEEAYLEAKAAHDLVVAGPREEAIAQAKAQVAIQEATAERLEDQITKHTIISRFEGYVVAEFTEEGAWVNRGDPIVEIVAVDDVEVIARVVEGSVPYIRPGQSTEVEFPALNNRRMSGTVMVTVPLADSRSRTFPVKVKVLNEITDAGPLLKPGMLSRVSLPVGVETTAMLVPKDAVVLGGPSPVVYAFDGEASTGAEGSVQPTPVRLGVSSGSLIQVEGSLKPGQLVVVEGNERLRPGQQVRISQVLEGSIAP